MKFRRTMLALCVTGLLTFFVACQRTDNGVQAAREERAANDNAAKPGDTATIDKNAMSPEDRDVAFKVERTHVEERDLARFVESKTNNGDVKGYAKMLDSDHNDSLNKLQDILKDKNVNESTTKKEPNEPSKMSKLQNAAGADFDRQYMTMMVQDHQKDLDELRSAEQTVQNPDLKNYIHDLIPVVQKHLDKAQDVMNNMAAKSGTNR